MALVVLDQQAGVSSLTTRPPQPARRKVALIGSHKTNLFAPWTDPSWDIWSHASSRAWLKRVPDRYFDLHTPVCWTRANQKGAAYPRWLAKNTVPIYMQEHYPEVPASIRYPKERIFAEFRRFFTNHAAWMIALALTEGYTHIGLFGINYGHVTEWETQRDSAIYWLGFAEGRGVTLVIPEGCGLLSTPAELYGYESHDAHGKLVASYRPKRRPDADGPTGLTLIDMEHPEAPRPPLRQPPDGVPIAWERSGHPAPALRPDGSLQTY